MLSTTAPNRREILSAEESVTRLLHDLRTKQDRLIRAAGGLLTEGAVARLRRTSPQDIQQRWRKRELLAVYVKSAWQYPAMQFDALGETPDGLTEAIRATIDRGPWGTLEFLLTENEELNSMTPLAALRVGAEPARQARRLLARLEADTYT